MYSFRTPVPHHRKHHKCSRSLWLPRNVGLPECHLVSALSALLILSLHYFDIEKPRNSGGLWDGRDSHPNFTMSDPNGPALQPPDGVIPRLDNPPNLNAYACATFVICLFFGTTATAIRLYSKFFLVKSVHLGDCK